MIRILERRPPRAAELVPRDSGDSASGACSALGQGKDTRSRGCGERLSDAADISGRTWDRTRDLPRVKRALSR